MHKKILVIGINEKIHSVARILEELNKQKVPFSFVEWSNIIFKDNAVYHRNKKLEFSRIRAAFFEIPSYNLIIKKENQKQHFLFRLNNELVELTKIMKENNIKILNRDFLLSYPFYNKFTQSQIFSNHKIPAIPTVHLTDNKLDKVLASYKNIKFDFPIVIKESLGGMGQNVWQAQDENELERVIKIRRNASLIFQPFIKNDGDYRVLIVGGKSLGIMRRTAQKNEWKNNFALGGKVENFSDPKMEKFAEKVARKMNLDYAGIDLFKQGTKYLVIEVNIFAAFEGFEKTYPKVNVAKNIVNYLIK